MCLSSLNRSIGLAPGTDEGKSNDVPLDRLLRRKEGTCL